MLFYRYIFTAALIFILNINIYSVTLTILPFNSDNEIWIEEYKVDDGIPRILEESLINTKMFNVTDYDLLISYFASYDIAASYKILQTNLQLASSFIKETFNSDYIITGNILDFNLKKGGKDTAFVKFKIDMININTLQIEKSFTDTGSYTLPNNSPIYTSEDAMFYETALGRASSIALNKTANNIGIFLKNPPLKGLITRVEDNKLYINLGSNNNIKIGDIFNIYKIDKILELPSTNIINNTVTNISNSPKTFTQTNQVSSGYISIRSNEKGDIWYTSEMLYKYRYYRYKEKLIASSKITEIYDNYAVLENITNNVITTMMIVKKIKD